MMPKQTERFKQINNNSPEQRIQKRDQFVIKTFYHMDSEPRWLDIQDQLYPQIIMMKQVVFQNTLTGNLTEFFSQIKYNSFKRQIDLTPLIFKYFFENQHHFNPNPSKNQPYEILIRDRLEQKLNFLGYFPNDDTYTLGQNFLSQEILYLIVKKEEIHQQIHQDLSQLKIEKQQKISYQVPQGSSDQQGADVQSTFIKQKAKQQVDLNSKTKPSKRKTIEEILKIIAQWRKFIMIKKLSSSEAADKVGMSKRSLEDYFGIIKLAEKYGFDFESKMKNGFAQLRNFVKEHHETRPAPKVQILQKFKYDKK